MAQSDSELITEVRGLTGYESGGVFADSDIQTIIDIGKEELRSEFGAPAFDFFTEESHDADRALFWFTCLGLKVRAGEIGGMELVLEQLEAVPQQSSYRFWADRLISRRNAAAMQLGGGISSVQISRTNRTYGDE